MHVVSLLLLLHNHKSGRNGRKNEGRAEKRRDGERRKERAAALEAEE